MRQQRDLGRDAEAPDLLGGQQRDLGDLLGGRIDVDVRVGDEHRARRQHHARSSPRRPVHPCAARSPGRRTRGACLCVPNMPHSMPSASPMWTIIAPISVCRRRISICAYCCETPLRSRQPVVLGPVGSCSAGRDSGLITSKSTPGFEAQSEALDPALEDRRPADEDRLREALVDDDLHRAQHALVLAFRVDDAPRAPSSPPRRSASSAGRSDRRTASAARDTRRSRRSGASRRRSPSPPWPPPARSSR